MNTTEHLKKLRNELNSVFDKTIEDQEFDGRPHYFSGALYEFSQHLSDQAIKEILTVVCAQLEGATLASAFGLYRQASHH
ncbi:hypothetical protein EYC79_11575 [Agrobacterium cavarae]|uniref:Phage protein n=1 Tax=Agrobacterium cavarae TaxID=2528239 RepID=A0ABY1YA68_9HYPH|nr:hypothetical protein [Agrobacterium cavarae]TBN12845.1 hypothetical protein EYC79_11575 [Agrobacterium cavarae]